MQEERLPAASISNEKSQQGGTVAIPGQEWSAFANDNQ
jgi:hypothetical protein